MDEILHHGSRGQNVHWSKESKSFTLLSPKELQEVASYTIEILKDSPTLVNVRAPVKVFGDIHGQFAITKVISRSHENAIVRDERTYCVVRFEGSNPMRDCE